MIAHLAGSPDLWSQLFNFANYGELLALVKNSIFAGAVLGIVGGLIGVFVMQRDMAFAVHGISELSFAGASAALLFGVNVVLGSLAGSLIAAILIGILGAKARDRNSIIAVLMPFGLGLGILFLALYPGRSANKFGLLTGQIVSVDDPQLGWLMVIGAVVVVGLLLIWRPLSFDSLDADVAASRGVPVRFVALAFMVLLGLAVAVSVQIVGCAARAVPARHAGGGGDAHLVVSARRAAAERGRSRSSRWSAASCSRSAGRCRSAPT